MSLTTSPTYPVPGDTVTLSEDGLTGNEVEYVLTSVPEESELELGSLRAPDGTFIDYFVPDVAGAYTLTERDYYRVQTAFGESRRYLLATRDVTAYVGSVLDMPIRTVRGHNVTLRCTVVNSTVRAATFVDPTTDLARMLSSQITTTLDALVGTTVATLGTSLLTGTAALQTAYTAHRQLTAGSVHAASDTDNVLRREAPTSLAAVFAVLEELADALTGHAANFDREVIGAGTWHTRHDTLNTPLSLPASDIATGTVRLADLAERVYERHRVQIAAPTVHGAADNTNTLATPTALTALIVDYLDRVALEDPATLTGENPGSGDLQAKHGFAA